MENDLRYWIALRAFEKFGPRSFERLLLKFSSMREAFEASPELLREAGIRQNIIDDFLHRREDIRPDTILERLEQLKIRAITRRDADYPPLLLTIYDPPPILFVKGTLPSPDIAHLAIVGSRKASPYGLRIASTMSRELAQAGLIIVSGLAWGIDEAAHLATIESQGITIAVLACGHLTLSGRQKYLSQKIIENNGAVLSEFLPETIGLKHYFPIRNRIISGMSHGTLVIEASEKSGSLLTARSALEQGRDVFAIPGPIDSETSFGTNGLLKVGAFPTTCLSDILDVLHVEKRPKIPEQERHPDSQEEARLLPHLSQTPTHIDVLVRESHLLPATTASTLTLLEMKGHVRHVGGMYYILI